VSVIVQKLASFWEALRTSLWFLPSLMVGGAVCLALAMIDLDGFSNRARLTERWPRVFAAGAWVGILSVIVVVALIVWGIKAFST
jgi:hypothetical protein